jgi:hypothetical protein
MEAQMAHTPGPWTVHQDHRSHEGFLIRGDGTRLVTAYCSADDARLISAALDLLEATQDLLRLLKDYGADDPLDTRVRDARAAIAKATGSEA